MQTNNGSPWFSGAPWNAGAASAKLQNAKQSKDPQGPQNQSVVGELWQIQVLRRGPGS